MTGENNNIITCSDDKSERVVIKEGDFKKVKNFDPIDGFEMTYDKITFNKSDAEHKPFYFKDKETNKVYAFMTDKNDKIVSGVIVEYTSNQHAAGIWVQGVKEPSFIENLTTLWQAKPKTGDILVPEYKGDSKDKEEIKSYIKQKVKDHSGGLEVTQAISKPDILNAADGLASTNAKIGNNYNATGAGTSNKSTFIS